MPRFLLLFLACLISLCLAAAPAVAQGWDDDCYDEHCGEDDPYDGYWDDEDGDDGEPDVQRDAPDGATPAPAPSPAPAPGLNPQLTPEPAPQEPEVTLVTTPTVPGRTARLRTNGKAAIPRGAPRSVRAIIAAANRIVGKPYKWGGGHARLEDRGYDCSGTVSYALIRAGLLGHPMVSGTLARWGVRGAGRWVTIYANAGHVYMEVAGLRLDTSSVGDWGGKKGPRWRPVIGKRKGFKVRHIAGL